MARFLNSAAVLKRSRWLGKFLPCLASAPGVPLAPGDAALMETGDFILLEDGFNLLLEA